jgi:pimeloyl-ACP methyl ester carboxylesterase
VRRPLRRVGAAGVVAAAATAVGAAATASAQRRRARRRWQGTDESARLGALHGEERTVIADDGVPLHVEVDEPPTADPTAPTLVFIHGWVLSLDCWHPQRLAFRRSHRMVFYDQRSHGRSGTAEPTGCTVDQLARDLALVIEATAPDGPLVLVGHSMGGMTIMEYAKQHPDVMKDRVVGLALLGTSAGDLGQVLPGRIGRILKTRSPSLLALGARAPRLVRTGRRITSGPAYWVTKRLAFGEEHVPPEYVAFTDSMVSASEASVIWDFWPLIAGLDQYASLAAFEGIPTLVVVGSRDVVTPIRHAYRIAELVPHSRVVVIEGAGHMIMLERADEVTKLIEDLVESR